MLRNGTVREASAAGIPTPGSRASPYASTHPVSGHRAPDCAQSLLPEVGICLRQAEISIPHAHARNTVYENHRTVGNKHTSGARQSAHVLAIAESPGKQVVAHHRFRTRVALADVRHAAMRRLLGCHCVNHTNLSSTLSAQHKCRLYDGKRNHRHQSEPSKTPASSFLWCRFYQPAMSKSTPPLQSMCHHPILFRRVRNFHSSNE